MGIPSKQKDRLSAAFEKYIQDKKILVADKSAVSRASIAGTLVHMGAKTPNIRLAHDYEAAEAEIRTHKPHVVICDYDLGKSCGLNLLQAQRKENPESRQCLFILVTGNTSQTAVARAAEEDVDTFVIKPFTKEVLRQSILKAAMLKVDPPEYLKAIDRGKEQLFAGKFDEAIETFRKAKTLDPAPALACFYLGEAKKMKKALQEAQGSYLTGLDFNKIHYKCLVGLYESLAEEKRDKEAYEVIKKISHYFPANPARLSAVLRLAIKTQSYDDVERYYRIFTGIDSRNEEIIRYVCAALVVCGKYYLQQNLGSRALELFQKAAITASTRTKILREIIVSLLEFGMSKQAAEYLAKFPAQTHGSVDYAAMSLLVADQSETKSKVIAMGRGLIDKGHLDPLIFQILVKRSAEAGLSAAAEDLAKLGSEKFPQSKAELEKLSRTPVSPAPSKATGSPKTT